MLALLTNGRLSVVESCQVFPLPLASAASDLWLHCDNPSDGAGKERSYTAIVVWWEVHARLAAWFSKRAGHGARRTVAWLASPH